MHQPTLFVLLGGLVGGTTIHASPVLLHLATQALPETSLVVPAGSRVLTRLTQPLSARTARPGDTVYLRVATPLVVDGQAVIAAGSFIEATATSAAAPAQSGRFEIGLRFRRLLGAQGDVADVFTVGGSLKDSTYRRGATAVAVLPGRDQIVSTEAVIALVVNDAFAVDSRRSLASAFGRHVRVVGSPPRLECLVESVMPTPDIRIPGTPPTPAIGDLPGTPGTPDIVIPGTPVVSWRWEPCR